jgi:hypothetical protein
MRKRDKSFSRFICVVVVALAVPLYWHEAARKQRISETVTFELIGKRGRLGNQLFQVASTIGIAESNGRCWAFPDSISTTTVGKLFNLKGSPDLRGAKYLEVKETNETSYSLILPDTKYGVAISLHGYFQNWQTFMGSVSTLKGYFQLDKVIVQTVKDRVPEAFLDNTVTVHVRRGDYTIQKYAELYLQLSANYYRNALSKIPDKEVVIIVSDDIQWCKDNLLKVTTARIIFSPFEDELHDFVLLYSSRHIIIANISFSWWAAFLKYVLPQSDSKVVVAPDTWYRPTGVFSHMNRRTFYPPDWTLIEAL